MTNYSIVLLLVAFLATAIPTPSHAYSTEYCTAIINASTEAMKARDWKSLLKVNTEAEKNCKAHLTAEEISDFIDNQSIALENLNRLDSALKGIERCLVFYKNPRCVFTKGIILYRQGHERDSLNHFSEAIRLAELDLKKTTLELDDLIRSGDKSESTKAIMYRLESRIESRKTIIKVAQSYLDSP